MKKTFSKLFMLLGVLLFLGAGNANAATWAIHGNFWTGNTTSNWDSRWMSQVDANTWIYSGYFYTGNFGIIEGWDNQTQNKWWSDPSSNTTIGPGNTKTLSTSGGNLWLGSAGNYTFTLKINNGTPSLTVASGLSESPLYLLTNNSGSWVLDSAAATLTSTNGTYAGTYTGEFEVTAAEAHVIFSTQFATSNSSWSSIEKTRFSTSSGDFKPTFTNNKYTGTMTQNSNGSYLLSAGKYSFSISGNNHSSITITQEAIAEPDYSSYQVRLCDKDGKELVNTNASKEGIATFTGVTGIDGGIQVTVNGGGWYNYYNNNDLPLEQWVTLTNQYGTNVKPTGAKPKSVYEIQFNVTNNTIWVKLTDEPTDYSSWWVNLRGDFNDWNGGGKQLTEDNPVATFENVAFSSKDKQGNGFKVMVYNGNDDTWYTADATIATGDWVQFENKEGQDNNTYVEGDNIYKTYTVEYNAETNQIKITPNEPNYPKNIYIYGNVNDWYWDVKVGVKMEPVEGQPGVYKAEDVEFSGQWDENAANMLPEEQRDTRPVGGSTGNENYVAFYEEVPNDFSGYKFGSNSTDNNIVINLNGGESQSSSVYFVSGNYANFQVYKGLYDVTFDLNTMTATWEKPQIKDSEENPVKEHVFNWWSGCNQKFEGMTANKAELIEDLTDDAENVHSDFDGYAFRTFEYGDDLNNVIQAGVDDNPMHLLAKQVNYTVFYRAPSDRPGAQKQQVKRLADESAPKEAITSVKQLTPGFVEAVKGTHYTMFGTDGYNDNCVLQLDLAGDYVVTADVKDDYDDNGINYIPVATSLFVTVQQATLNVSTGNEISVAFNPAADNEFEEMISLSAKLEYGKDFTLEFEPVNVEEWAVPSDPENLEASYRAAVTDAIYQLENIGFDSKIDGFYTGVTDINAVQTSNTGGYYTYTVTANVPCSGLYTVKVVPSDNYQVEEDATASVEVYPNLQGIFGGKVHGFLINDYTFGEGSEGTIAFDDNFTDEMRAACFGEYPGTYFIDAISSTTPAADAAFYGAKRMAKVTDYLLPMNLTDQSSTEITVVKNGATGTHKFEITTSEEAITGVDSVEAVDGEAVYFNLQGQKVDNPDKGIYIKVSGGKASKVIL